MLTKSGTRALGRLLAVPHGNFRELTYHKESDTLVLVPAKPKKGIVTQSFYLCIDLGYFRAYCQTVAGTVTYAGMFRGNTSVHPDIRNEESGDPDILESILSLCDHIGEYPCQIEIEYPQS